MVARRYAVAAGAIGVALALTACGGDSDKGAKSDGPVVGIILPDSKSSGRWEGADRPALDSAFKNAGVKVDIQNAENDAAKMQTIADQMITKGIKVLAIVNLDSASGAAIQAKAKAAGVKSIDYDRLTLGGSADYYVSFDNTAVGKLQGEGLAKCLGDKPANIVYLNGAPTDNNATLFKQGAKTVLDAKKDKYTVVGDQAVPEWDNVKGGTIFEQMYKKQNGKIDGVLAANDGLGGAAIAILKKNSKKIPVTGQDATPEGLQNVLAGDQCMSVYKSAKQEAGAVAELAIALSKGEKGNVTGKTKDSEGNRDVPSVLLTPVAVYKETVKDVIADGGAKKEDVCKGAFVKLCTDNGVS